MLIQTYEFWRPDKTRLPRTTRNAIAYLEKRNNDPLPSGLAAIFDTTNGNFVTDDMPWKAEQTTDGISIMDSNILGSMCLSSDILFGSHFAPLLKPIVKMTHVHLLKSRTDSGAEREFEWDLTFDGHPDHPDYRDSYYDMKRMPGVDDVWNGATWVGEPRDGNRGECENKHGYRWIMGIATLDDHSEKFWKDTWIRLQGSSAKRTTHGKNYKLTGV